MSKTFGLISWNVLGDRGADTGPQRLEDLQEIIDDIQEGGLPVDFICLQETSGAEGYLMPGLMEMGYACQAVSEQGSGGKQYVVAINPGSGYVFGGDLEQVLFQYESSSGSPLRYPARAHLVSGDYPPVMLYTVHASLDGGLVECLEQYSRQAEESVNSESFGAVFVTGDLNITEHSQICTDKGETAFIDQIFPSFEGVNHHLDHVYCWAKDGIERLDGHHYTETTSDHDLVYAWFTLC